MPRGKVRRARRRKTSPQEKSKPGGGVVDRRAPVKRAKPGAIDALEPRVRDWVRNPGMGPRRVYRAEWSEGLTGDQGRPHEPSEQESTSGKRKPTEGSPDQETREIGNKARVA